jgi:hypothetical protein
MCAFVFSFTHFCCYLYHFLPSACFGLTCLLLDSQDESTDDWLESLLLSDVSILGCAVCSQNCLIPHIHIFNVASWHMFSSVLWFPYKIFLESTQRAQFQWMVTVRPRSCPTLQARGHFRAPWSCRTEQDLRWIFLLIKTGPAELYMFCRECGRFWPVSAPPLFPVAWLAVGMNWVCEADASSDGSWVPSHWCQVGETLFVYSGASVPGHLQPMWTKVLWRSHIHAEHPADLVTD